MLLAKSDSSIVFTSVCVCHTVYVSLQYMDIEYGTCGGCVCLLRCKWEKKMAKCMTISLSKSIMHRQTDREVKPVKL